ncbi:expressed protein [Chlorella variabilis]|uniref:Expressed protein n=1 Tax=Chlorella variabilis TaxID=554065 RepID=E1ZGJ9_CHLVA|nr:expressed protein [Chlorella variabilis]EFN54771.1 expressed protein [Chlorella variabilis]|eukprot:XP_005846873.1 expressed protein [Chlorella variabilis]
MARTGLFVVVLALAAVMARGDEAPFVYNTVTAVADRADFKTTIKIVRALGFVETYDCTGDNKIFLQDFLTCDFTWVEDVVDKKKVISPVKCPRGCAKQWGKISEGCYEGFRANMVADKRFGKLADNFFDECKVNSKADVVSSASIDKTEDKPAAGGAAGDKPAAGGAAGDKPAAGGAAGDKPAATGSVSATSLDAAAPAPAWSESDGAESPATEDTTAATPTASEETTTTDPEEGTVPTPDPAPIPEEEETTDLLLDAFAPAGAEAPALAEAPVAGPVVAPAAAPSPAPAPSPSPAPTPAPAPVPSSASAASVKYVALALLGMLVLLV